MTNLATHRSFGEQALHYFIRPADGIPATPLVHPAAWRGQDMREDPERWIIPFTKPQIDELQSAARKLVDQRIPLTQITTDLFPLPSLKEALASWRHTLKFGTGVLCLRGLPTRSWGEELSSYVYWGLGHHLGQPGAQNPDDELLGHVTDYGESATKPLARMYRSTGGIRFHCDAADVVGLLCLRRAREGGQSRIASSVTVYNEIAAQRPDLISLLFENFAIDRRNEELAGQAPFFEMPPCSWDGTTLRTFWHSDYMRSAARHPAVTISPARAELMDLYDSIASRPDIHLDMWLEEGDIQLISNHTVIHSRTEYEDYPDPTERRHLLRLWLSLG